MVFSQQFIDSIQRYAEMQRNVEQKLADTYLDTTYFNSTFIEAAQRHAEWQQEIEEILERTAVFQIQESLESMPLHEMAAAQQRMVQSSVAEAAIQSTEIYENIAINQHFIEAIEQSATIADSIEELQRMALISQYQLQQPFEEDVFEPDVQPTSSIYDQTVDPYESVREDIYDTQQLIAAYVIAAATDQGELSNELSESEKKHIRIGLAVVIGLAAGLPASFVVGPVGGAGVALGAGSWTSRELDEYYDIKQRQKLPEDGSKACPE